MRYRLPFRPSLSVWTDEDASKEYYDILLDGGMPRSRLNVINGARKVGVQWELPQAEYALLRHFYRMMKLSGEDFEVQIPFEDGVLAWRQARFVAGSFKDVSSSGWNGFIVAAQLWVMPLLRDDAHDLSVFMLENTYGGADKAVEFMNLLEKLVNVDLPDALEDVPGPDIQE